jgi:holo-[acyl-carrier protein] synthase
MIVSIGIDIVEVERVERAVERHGSRFLEKIFTQPEIAYCEAKAARFVHYAGRFAAKEAAMKALGTGWGQGVAWREVEILPSSVGPPQLVLHGIARAHFEALGATKALLSISHTHIHAVAQVLFEG